MSWMAAAVVGGAVIGGTMSSNAQKESANTAANAQVQAAQLGVDEQQRQFDAVQKLLAPYVNASTGAGAFDSNAYLRANPDVASDPYWGANPEQHYLQRGQFEGRAKPMTGVGYGSLTAQQDILGLNGGPAQQKAISGIESSPMFAGLMQQGENAILQNASATGGLRGGNTQAALAQFRPQLLNQLIESQYAKLGGLTSLGQNAAAGVGNAGMSTGSSIAGLLQQQGAAQAGAALAGGRADSQLYGGIGNAVGLFGSLGGFGGGATATGPQVGGASGAYGSPTRFGVAPGQEFGSLGSGFYGMGGF